MPRAKAFDSQSTLWDAARASRTHCSSGIFGKTAFGAVDTAREDVLVALVALVGPRLNILSIHPDRR